MAADFEIRTSGDLKRLSRQLRQLNDTELKKRMSRELRAAAKPLVPRVRAAARQIPSQRGYRADGLRGALSRAVKVEVKPTGRQVGVRIRVDGRKMPDHMKSLPQYIEGNKPRWRHPVYGKDVWVQQNPKPFFYKALTVAGPIAQAAAQRVLDGIERDLAR